LQALKDDWQRIVTEEGMQIDVSEEHPWNAPDSIRSSLESDSNVKAESNGHSPKQDSPRIVTEEGIQIDFSDEPLKNAFVSIRSSLEFDPNVNVESDWHPLKHDGQRFEMWDKILTSADRPKYRIN
jgi:hypothetical protein